MRQALAIIATVATICLPLSVMAATTPTILDTLPIAGEGHLINVNGAVSTSTTYTVPSSGVNKLEVLIIGDATGGLTLSSATQNGVSMKVHNYNSNCAVANQVLLQHYAVLANPTTGTLTITMSGSGNWGGYVVTLQDAAPNDPVDAFGCAGSVATKNYALTSTTTISGNDILLTLQDNDTAHSLAIPGPGGGQTQIATSTKFMSGNTFFSASWIAGSTTAKSVTVSENLAVARSNDEMILAIALATSTAAGAYPDMSPWFNMMHQ